MRKRKYGTFSVISKIAKDAKSNKMRWLIHLILINAIIAGVLPVVSLYIPRVVIDYIALGNQEGMIKNIVILVLIALLLAVSSYMLGALSQSGRLTLRISKFKDYVAKFQSIDYWHMENPKSLDEMDYNVRSLQENASGYEGTIAYAELILIDIVSILVYSVIVGMFNALILLATLSTTILIILINRKITKYQLSKKEDLSRATRKKRYFNEISYDFSYGKDIRIFDMKEKLTKDYKAKSYSYISVIKNIANYKFKIGLTELLLLLLQDGIGYYFIIIGYLNGKITVGEVTLYIGIVIALSTALRNIALNISQINTECGYVSDTYEFLEGNAYNSLSGNRKRLDEQIEIEFKNVDFKYPNTDKYILKNFSFKINKGERLAIIGVNGAGKSTLVKIATGLFAPTSGDVLVNGISIKEFDAEEYRKMFAVVFQDVHLYAATILENIIGVSTAEEDIARAKECLEKVGLKKKIESLPRQYNHQLLKVIEEDGVELSGGEAQKLAIARALYKDSNVVILDEPTSALDALAEASIYQSFDDLVKDKTAIYISHRLSSTKFCDKIVLLGENGIEEYGTHDELMAKKGEYYHMFTIQGKYYQGGEDYE